MSKYLDITGLTYFWEKAKTYMNTIIPTKTSDLTNDSGYITDYSVDFPLILDGSNLELDLMDSNNNAKRISSISLQSYSGVTGLQFNYIDGHSNGLVFLPDGVSMNNKYQEAMSLMPSSTSDLINDSGFINSVAVSSSGSGNVVTELSASGDTITYTLGNVSTNAAQIIRNNSTTDISTLKIHYLTQAEYETALANNQINENELYFTLEQ